MAGDFWPQLTSEPDPRDYRIRIVGTGADDPTVDLGRGVSVGRVAEGVYRITWRVNPGTFLGIAGWAFGAATPADVKGHSITRDEYSSAGGVFTLDVSVWDSSFAADDLEATEFLDLTVSFRV